MALKLQWFTVTHKGMTYQEIADVREEKDGKCYLSNGMCIPSSRKCERGQYPLLPQNIKFK